MSSVLRALKKLEKEKEIVAGQNFWPPNAPVVISGFRDVFAKAGIFFLITLAFITAMICYDYFLAGRDTPQPEQQSTAGQKDIPAPSQKQVADAPVLSATVAPLPEIEPETDELIADEAVAVDEAAAPVAMEPEMPDTAPPAPAEHLPPEPEELPILQEAGLKLLAIAWSSDADKRVAVVNNRVLHENDAIAGYLLVAITQDELVLKKHGVSWRLPLKQ